MDKLVFARKRRRKAEVIRLNEKASAIVNEVAAQSGVAVQTIVSQMVIFCKERVEIVDETEDDEDE